MTRHKKMPNAAESRRPPPGLEEASSATDALRPNRSDWLFAAALVVVVFLAYQPAWNGGLVWDDDLHLKNNPVLKPGGLADAWLKGDYINYWPMTFSVYRLEYALWGLNPLGYHLVNIALHAISALLVWRVLLCLRIPGALLAAGIFALHPVNVESVAWIAQLKNVLSLALGLAAMLLFLLHERHGGWWRLTLSAALFLLSALAKGMMLTMPVVMLACAWWQRGRIDRRDLLRVLPFVVIAVVMATVEVMRQHQGSADVVIRSDGFWGRAAVAGCAVWFYLGKVIWPADLMFVYPRWNIDANDVFSYVPGLLLVVILGVAWWQRRSWGRPVVMLLICYVVLLAPILGFVTIIYMQYSLVADHWQYAAMIVPCAALAGGLTWLARRARLPHPSGPVLAVAMLTVLSCQTYSESRMFDNIKTLYQTAIERNPRCWLIQNNLGELFMDEGKVDKAIECYEDAIRSNRNFGKAYCNLGNVLASQGRSDEAIPRYEAALKLDQQSVEAHYNYAVTLAKEGEVADAIEHYKIALKINPDHVDSLNNLAWLRATLPRADYRDGKEAVKLADRALRLTSTDNPSILGILDTLAAAHAEADEYDQAAKTERLAVETAEVHGLKVAAAQLRKRLEMYEAGQPYRQQLPQTPRRNLGKPGGKPP